MAQEARKPAFLLRAADGAIGGHLHAVRDCHHDFEVLAEMIADKCGVGLVAPTLRSGGLVRR